MTIERRTLVYDGPGGPFEGVVAWDSAVTGPRPAVLILPNILGQKEFDNRKAEALAELGYVALAADIYGQGKRPQPGPDRAVYMNQLNADRGLMRDRLHASLAALVAQPEADPGRAAAIGFCFGGKAVLDLARSGADVRGVVCFHGVYDRPDYPTATPLKPAVLVCHGWNDPLCPPDTVTALATELTEAQADWQLHAYGDTGHAFTDPDTPMNEERTFGYNPASDRRSWKAMQDFLAEVLG